MTSSRDLVTRDGLRDPSHVVFGYHPSWRGTAWQNYSYDILSHLAWFSLEMTSTGAISDSNGWPIHSLVDLAHTHGVKVIVTVTLFVNDDIGTLVGNPTYRQNAIDNLISKVNEGNADGVNIDFEFVPSYARSNFNTFIHDLTQAFHDQIPGSEVSIAMPSVDWNSAYDYNYLSDNADGLMIMAYGYYWSGSDHAGPQSPLYGGLSTWHIQRTIDDYTSKTGGDASQLILGLPWYGRDWPVASTEMNAEAVGTGDAILYSSAEPEAQSYGKNYNSQVEGAWYNYTSGGFHQVWYDDSLSLSAKYNYAINNGLKGIGIWALSYDGGRSEIWGGLSDAFGASSSPQVSAYFNVKNVGDGTVEVNCAPASFTDQYKAYISYDGETFELADSSATPQILLENLPDGELVYVKIKNANAYGSSQFSELLATVVSTSEASSVLIVQGFERISGTVNNFDYIIEHGSAIHATARLFDGASNDAIETGAVNMSDYDIVDWISGEEATATVSFSSSEQTRIMAYLEAGGRLFISGSEIGYDLEHSGSSEDISFYHNYFKADYISDDASSYSVSGPSFGIFSAFSGLDFDNGIHGTYDVDYPDGIKPMLGSINNLRYDGAEYDITGGAGIQYLGTFGESNLTGGLVYLGFGFETIYPETARNSVMATVLDYLDTLVEVDPEAVLPDKFQVSAAYPNPFNGSFSLTIKSREAGPLSISLYNLRGQLVHRLRKSVSVGDNVIRMNDLSIHATHSGVYVLEVRNGSETHTQNITYLK